MSHKTPKPEGKEQGLSFGRCFAKAKLYSRSVPGPLPYLYIIPFFLAYLVLDFAVRGAYRDAGMVGLGYLPASLFTLGWALIFSGLVFALPTVPKWFVRCVPLVTFVSICVTHSGFMNMFGRFFSFSVLKYAGTAEFFDASYIHLDWRVVLGAAVTVLLMMTSGRLLQVVPPKLRRETVLGGVAAFLLGVGLVGYTSHHYYPTVDEVIWRTEEETLPALTYQNFTDTTNCVLLSGVYQYSVRDFWLLFFPGGRVSPAERQQIDQYISAYEKTEQDNDFTGRFAGKNLILVQLEALDTWMLDPDYMPNLSRVKEQSIRFNKHYTPSYIAAGTFNTEFQVHTSLLPATGGIPTYVYERNSFPYALPKLFGGAGYTARSFHNSGGDIYSRGAIHPNLGYESYTSGADMGMEETSMDRYLINGFEEMVKEEPFFSTVITFSPHGNYGPDTPVYLAHPEAQRIAKNQEGFFPNAVAGAMETDLFVGALMEKLEESGHLEDTVVVFYTDHYNYYLQNDALIMEMKGVDNMNLIRHTEFFIYAQGQESMDVEKVTGSVDILPTLANLFGLDTQGAFLVGHDALGDQGGYVFFEDGSWYDGETYWDSSSDDDGNAHRRAEIAWLINLNNALLRGDYYAARTGG